MRRVHLALAVLALSLWTTPWWSGVSAQGAATVAVVVNRANPVENLSLAQLRDVLMGKTTTWSNGKRVVVVLTDEGDSRTAVLRACCHQTAQEYDNAMLRLVFTGDIPAAPRHVDTADAVSKFVFNVAGGIGLVPVDRVTDTVKTIRIGGLAPTDAAYPLKSR